MGDMRLNLAETPCIIETQNQDYSIENYIRNDIFLQTIMLLLMPVRCQWYVYGLSDQKWIFRRAALRPESTH